MKQSAIISNLVHIGISEAQPIETSSRIKIINKFNLLCICYSIPYILFSLTFEFYLPATVFFFGQIFYCISLYCNKVGYYNLAKFLILLATNYSVFYLSLFYGYRSGFHLYYFTTPLIVFSLFNFNETYKIVCGMLLYLISLAILLYFYRIGVMINSPVPGEMINLLYSINIFLSLSFCLLLVTHFSSYNKTMNEILISNNIELENKQSLLESEIDERKNSEIKLQTLLNDKEILLSETHHRVKNNLAVVSGMLDLQVLMTDEHKIKTILSDSRSRIKSMSLIHESLYKFDNVSQIEFSQYIKTLAEGIKNAQTSLSSQINIIYDLDTINLNVSKAIPCGLLINEVITNSIKHAFLLDSGEIRIIFKKKDNLYQLEISDNGTGINIKDEDNSMSIGMTLIEAFVKQLNGKHEFSNADGTKLKLTFEA